MDYDHNTFFTIQFDPYIFLAENCIELGPFRTRLSDYLSYILRPAFTTLIRAQPLEFLYAMSRGNVSKSEECC